MIHVYSNNGGDTPSKSKGTNYKKSKKQKAMERQRKKANKKLNKSKLRGFARGSNTNSKADAVKNNNAMIMRQITAASNIGDKNSANSQGVFSGLRRMLSKAPPKRPVGTVGNSAVSGTTKSKKKKKKN